MPEGTVSVKPLKSPDEWIAKQIGNLKAVGQANYIKGISSPRRDPIQAGIAAEQKYANNLRKAIDEQRRAKALSATNMQTWYKYAVEIGAPRLVEGVVKREEKVRNFVTKWHPLLAAHVEKIRSMPDATDADREARMLENLRGLKSLKGAWRK
jgi:hypothetical protein